MGYLLSHDSIKPDPDQFKPLMELALSSNGRELKRVLGTFAYYAKWIFNFSQKIRALSQADSYPLTTKAAQSFKTLKEDLLDARLQCIHR